MNGARLAGDAGVAGAVGMVVVGAGLAAYMIGGVVHERDRLRAQARPRPASTVTVAMTTVITREGTEPSRRPSAAPSRTLVAAAPEPDRRVPVVAVSGPSPRPQAPVQGGGLPFASPGMGARCTPADLSICLRLGIAPRHAIGGGDR